MGTRQCESNFTDYFWVFRTRRFRSILNGLCCIQRRAHSDSEGPLRLPARLFRLVCAMLCCELTHVLDRQSSGMDQLCVDDSWCLTVHSSNGIFAQGSDEEYNR